MHLLYTRFYLKPKFVFFLSTDDAKACDGLSGSFTKSHDMWRNSNNFYSGKSMVARTWWCWCWWCVVHVCVSVRFSLICSSSDFFFFCSAHQTTAAVARRQWWWRWWRRYAAIEIKCRNRCRRMRAYVHLLIHAVSFMSLIQKLCVYTTQVYGIFSRI